MKNIKLKMPHKRVDTRFEFVKKPLFGSETTTVTTTTSQGDPTNTCTTILTTTHFI